MNATLVSSVRKSHLGMTHAVVASGAHCYSVGLWDDGSLYVARETPKGFRYVLSQREGGKPITSPTAQRVLSALWR
jgi:hypothetical protein